MRIRHITTSIAALFVLLSFQPGFAQQGQAGTESNLSAGFGARAFSMGQAFTAIADDPSAVFWNPAGLEYVYQQSVTMFHMSLFEGTLYDFLGYAYPTLNLGTFGFGVARIGIGGITQTDITNYRMGTFSWDEFQGFFSYAKRLPWNITPGITVRVLRRAFNGLQGEGNLVDTGVGMDLGLMYRPDYFTSPWLRDWSVGLNVRNVFKPQVKEGRIIDELPLSVRLGLARKIVFGGGNYLRLAVDFDYSQKRDVFIHFGTEYRFRDLGMLRVGFDGQMPTFGAGIKYSIFQLDYAFGSTAYSDVFSSIHRFSLSFNFGVNRDQLFELAEQERKEKEDKLIARMREADRQKFVATHLKKADDYFNKSKYFDAFVEYQQVIGRDPFNTRAKIMLDSSDVLLKKELDKEQTLAIRNALNKQRAKSNREYVKEHFEKGRTLLDKKQFTEALIEFNIARERAPNDPTIIDAINTTNRRMSEELTKLIQEGRREFQNGNYSKALQLLSDARVLGGDNPAIQTEIEALSKRIKLQEDIQKGLGLFEIGQYDQALKIFEEALKINPKSELAKQYYEKSKIETAGKTEKLDPVSEKNFLQGVKMFVRGKYKEAIGIWEAIQKKYPYNKKVLKALKGARERLNKSK